MYRPIAVPGVPTLDPAGERMAECPAHGADCSHPHAGGHWSRAVNVLGLSLRPGNRQHDAVGVAAQSRAGWTIARVSASVVAVDRRPGRWSRGQRRPRSWLCGSARCLPSVSCRFLTAGCFPPLVAGGGGLFAGLGVLFVALRPCRRTIRSGTARSGCSCHGGGSTRSARQRRGRSQDRPRRNELWREGLHGRL